MALITGEKTATLAPAEPAFTADSTRVSLTISNVGIATMAVGEDADVGLSVGDKGALLAPGVEARDGRGGSIVLHKQAATGEVWVVGNNVPYRYMEVKR